MISKERYEMLKEAERTGANLAPVDYENMRQYEQARDSIGQAWAKEHGWKSPEEVRRIMSDPDYYPVAINEAIEQAVTEAKQEAAREIFAAYDKYIQLLGDELNEIVGLAVVHGWKTTRFEQGVDCRNEIEALKARFALPKAEEIKHD